MKIGSLFSGVGGLDLAALELFPGSSMAWHAEIDPAASKVLAHHWTDIPNLGDVSTVDWSQVEPVDVLTGGFPCQDVSLAGRRAGLSAGTRSGLWSYMAAAIDVLRPRYVLVENVRGLLSAEAIRGMEPGSGAVGDMGGRHVLRALGAVLGSLADLGFDAEWTCLPASKVGAAHRRERVFVLAFPADADSFSVREQPKSQSRGGVTTVAGWSSPGTTNATSERNKDEPISRDGEGQPLGAVAGAGDRNHARGVAAGVRKLGGTSAIMAEGVNRLLPTPQVADVTGGHRTRSGARSAELLLPGVAEAYAKGALLPTPRTSDTNGPGRHGDGGLDLRTAVTQWGDYALAIRRQEALSRPAPSPTEPNSKGNQRLSAAFAEWLMFWPAGWVTDPVIGLSRNDQLRCIGNGVVPPQAVAAFRQLLSDLAVSPIEGGAA
jgi:DNA (cytosine-5)-methyltransferase 1